MRGMLDHVGIGHLLRTLTKTDEKFKDYILLQIFIVLIKYFQYIIRIFFSNIKDVPLINLTLYAAFFWISFE